MNIILIILLGNQLSPCSSVCAWAIGLCMLHGQFHGRWLLAIDDRQCNCCRLVPSTGFSSSLHIAHFLHFLGLGSTFQFKWTETYINHCAMLITLHRLRSIRSSWKFIQLRQYTDFRARAIICTIVRWIYSCDFMWNQDACVNPCAVLNHPAPCRLLLLHTPIL